MKKLMRRLLSPLGILTAFGAAIGCGAEADSDLEPAVTAAPLALELGQAMSDATCQSVVLRTSWPAPITAQQRVLFIVSDRVAGSSAYFAYEVGARDTTILRALRDVLVPFERGGERRIELRAQLEDMVGNVLSAGKTSASLPCSFPFGG